MDSRPNLEPAVSHQHRQDADPERHQGEACEEFPGFPTAPIAGVAPFFGDYRI